MNPSSHRFFESDALGKLLTCHLLSRNPWINMPFLGESLNQWLLCHLPSTFFYCSILIICKAWFHQVPGLDLLWTPLPNFGFKGMPCIIQISASSLTTSHNLFGGSVVPHNCWIEPLNLLRFCQELGRIPMAFKKLLYLYVGAVPATCIITSGVEALGSQCMQKPKKT